MSENPLPHTQEEESKLAQTENRQPRCVYCGELLDVVGEVQDIQLTWTWDKEKKCYVKSEGDGSSCKPYCGNCEAKDWDFTNNDFIQY